MLEKILLILGVLFAAIGLSKTKYVQRKAEKIRKQYLLTKQSYRDAIEASIKVSFFSHMACVADDIGATSLHSSAYRQPITRRRPIDDSQRIQRYHQRKAEDRKKMWEEWRENNKLLFRRA